MGEFLGPLPVFLLSYRKRLPGQSRVCLYSFASTTNRGTFMKAKNLLIISVLSGLMLLSCSTTCGARLLPKKAEAAPVETPATPELAAADERVGKARTQLETARKQLEAARAMLRAAEADYRAAKAAREALALQTKAQGLADASGLGKLAAQTGATSPAAAPPPAAPVATPAAAPADLSQTRIQQVDFNAEPAAVGDPVQLR